MMHATQLSISLTLDKQSTHLEQMESVDVETLPSTHTAQHLHLLDGNYVDIL